MQATSLVLEDRHWAGRYRHEPYCRADVDYEDYAPAYCVGYSGCAQYGGAFEDAERSLCANWERIKGDSRLSWDEALPAVRAAWNRLQQLDAAYLTRATSPAADADSDLSAGPQGGDRVLEDAMLYAATRATGTAAAAA